MPDKVTLKIFFFLTFLFIQLNLTGQDLAGGANLDPEEEANRGAGVEEVLSGVWYFPYENMEKAIAADPAASERYISLEGPWKYSYGEDHLSENFYISHFDDSAWEVLNMPETGRQANAPVGEAPQAEPEVIFLRKKVRLDETWAEKPLFISPGAYGAATVWINGQEVGRTKAGSGKQEFNISSFIQPGENLLALKVDLKSATESGSEAEQGMKPAEKQGLKSRMEPASERDLEPNAESVEASRAPLVVSCINDLLLYARPQLHFNAIAIHASLDEQMEDGILSLDLRVENRMDSVRERFWGVLREPIYSTVNIHAQLVDDKGNEIVEFNKESKRKIQGGDSLAFHFEGKVNDVKPWSHETPYCYRLNITLLDDAGQVLEAVSQQVGFRTVAVEGGMLQVNGTRVPLRVFRPGPRSPFSMDREQMMRDIRQIKQGSFNAVRASSYFTGPSWYRLSNRHGIYVLGKHLHGQRNHPSAISAPQGKSISEAAKPVVEFQLADFLEGTIRVRNHFAFRDLSDYYLQWEILRNGRAAEEGRVEDLLVQPGQEAGISLGYNMRFYEGNDYFLNLRLKTNEGDTLVPANFTMASRQFRLSPYHYEEEYQVDKGLIDATDGPGAIALNGYDFRIVFDKGTGHISRYSYKGKELINDGPELNFRKLQIPQDSLEEAHALWNEAAEDGHLIDYQITEDVNGNYYVSFSKVLLGGDARLFQKFRVDGRGAILVENVFVKMQGDYPFMPGFGTSFRLPGDYSRMEWYGREPGAFNEVGIYSGPIDAYAGNDKGDVRWVRLTREDGYGLLIRKEDQLLHLTAMREGPKSGETGETRKTGETAKNSPVLLSVDLSQEPLPFKSMNFTYRIIPYASSANVQ